MVRIHMRATTEPMLHADGLSGQTPIEHTSGVRSLQLFKTASDPNPLTVFDFGQDYVEVSYADGADTVIHAAPASELPEAHYTLARTVHSHVRYRVASTMHVSGMTLAGEFDNLQVLSDGTMIDGALRDHGYFEFIFVTGSSSYPWSGANAPVPEWADTGGFTVKLEQGEWAYYYPVDLPVTANIAEDMDIVLEVNMHESFRWQDESHPGFAAGQFDTTPLSFEPVKRFGASSYELYLE